MKHTSAFALTGAALAAALLSSGCRTIHPTEGEIVEPPPPASVSDGAETLAVPDAPEASIPAAADVGKDGTYLDFVNTSDGENGFEANGLQGRTGRHVPAPPPAPEPAPTVAPAPAGSGFYVVQAGDIFGRIAQKHGVSQRALREANPEVKDPNKIRVGQKLRIPARGAGLAPRAEGPAAPAQGAARPAAPRRAATLPPKPGYTVYVVQQNDILGRIANRNHTTVKALMEANGITDARKLRAGQAIYVPAAGEAPAPAPAEAAAPAPAPAEAPAEAPAPVTPDGATAGMSDAFLSGVDL